MAPATKLTADNGPFSALSATEMKLLALGNVFHTNGTPNYDDMAKWTGLKASSAGTLHRGAKRKLARALGIADTPNPSPTKAGPARKRAKKPTAKTAKSEVNDEKAVEESAVPIKEEPAEAFDTDDSAYSRDLQYTIENAHKAAQAINEAVAAEAVAAAAAAAESRIEDE
ncbi:hypothetical protein PENANT_c020G06616 [Penicillium antarcticum]|uniref:Uncharacterized protein n=1 Tax=Penicillium antarcticum TaxID=416450 RepID=A0A1V6Q1U1_9EURO|nr:uncharacterized protein N7508_004334 [Penicillium antarcticum]KAJ5308955.1 hypothetical protein N7508_004334 [Penicillium antarcticum]OQD82696.1 hypothetical protein PENANT_c020G06616 [Penicillium antarcticum]